MNGTYTDLGAWAGYFYQLELDRIYDIRLWIGGHSEVRILKSALICRMLVSTS